MHDVHVSVREWDRKWNWKRQREKERERNLSIGFIIKYRSHKQWRWSVKKQIHFMHDAYLWTFNSTGLILTLLKLTREFSWCEIQTFSPRKSKQQQSCTNQHGESNIHDDLHYFTWEIIMFLNVSVTGLKYITITHCISSESGEFWHKLFSAAMGFLSSWTENRA